MNRLNKPVIFIVVFLMIIAILPLNAFAEYIPYDGYTYDFWENSVPSANAYEPQKALFSDSQQKVFFNKPADMVIDDETGNIFILNSGDKTVVVLDKNRNLLTVLDHFTDKDGSTTELMEPNGIFYKNNLIYIADGKLQKVLVSDMKGNIHFAVTKPQNPIFPQASDFIPLKVLVDNMNYIYVIAQSVNYGALSFDDKGNFIEFFGSNKVEVTANLLSQKFWRLFMNEKQIASTTRAVPIEYSNFDIDKDNFIYTSTAAGNTSGEQIRMLNPVGNNLFAGQRFGDFEYAYYKNQIVATRFVDVSVNRDGFIYGLDEKLGRVFVYDNEGNSVTILGTLSSQMGGFKQPVAIDNYEKDIYVLDREKGCIMTFSLTNYGKMLYEGTSLIVDGKYTQAREIFENVIKQNSNCLVAYYSIGKSLFYKGEYTEAMKYFELAGSRRSESKAFEELRKSTMRNVTGVIIVLSILGFILYLIIRRKVAATIESGQTMPAGKGNGLWHRLIKGVSSNNEVETKSSFRRYIAIVFHPVDGFEDMKYKKDGSVVLATVFVVFWFLVTVLDRQYVSFRFNYYQTDNTNILFIIISTVVVFLFFVVANWSVTSIFDGEGTFKEIYILTGYAILPYAFSLFVNVVLSYVLVTSEASFIGMVSTVGFLVSLFMLFFGIMQIHRYRVMQTVFALAASVLGVFVILFLGFLLVTLFQQLFSFIGTIYDEILTRLAS